MRRCNFTCGDSACGDGVYAGANAGTGIAFKVSENSNFNAFFELRYVWIDTSSQALDTTATTGKQTSFLPVTLGSDGRS